MTRTHDAGGRGGTGTSPAMDGPRHGAGTEAGVDPLAGRRGGQRRRSARPCQSCCQMWSKAGTS